MQTSTSASWSILAPRKEPKHMPWLFQVFQSTDVRRHLVEQHQGRVVDKVPLNFSGGKSLSSLWWLLTSLILDLSLQLNGYKESRKCQSSSDNMK